MKRTRGREEVFKIVKDCCSGRTVQGETACQLSSQDTPQGPEAEGIRMKGWKVNE